MFLYDYIILLYFFSFCWRVADAADHPCVTSQIPSQNNSGVSKTPFPNSFHKFCHNNVDRKDVNRLLLGSIQTPTDDGERTTDKGQTLALPVESKRNLALGYIYISFFFMAFSLYKPQICCWVTQPLPVRKKGRSQGRQGKKPKQRGGCRGLQTAGTVHTIPLAPVGGRQHCRLNKHSSLLRSYRRHRINGGRGGIERHLQLWSLKTKRRLC